jgi:outer membrane protein OmpA-like peptidoglycan-associated protein
MPLSSVQRFGKRSCKRGARAPFLVGRGAASLALAALLVASGCQTNTGTALDKKTTQGAVLGALAGAAAGRAIGGHDNAAAGILIGAAAGGLTGGLIGNYLDRQQQELDAIPDATVQRREDTLILSFPGDVVFDSGSATLSAGAYERLRTVADSLRQYPDTDLVVKGHTDSVGSDSFNLDLSEQRAESVRKFLVAEGVSAYRITAIGFGEQFPLATNASPEGRAQNRRVEIEIRPNQELQERAAETR